jgi:hypothetical protein
VFGSVAGYGNVNRGFARRASAKLDLDVGPDIPISADLGLVVDVDALALIDT